MEDKELEKIMQRKMMEYMERLRKTQEQTQEERREDILEKIRPLLTQDAYNHLKKIRDRDPRLGGEMIKILIELLYLGYIRTPIDYVVVERLRRKLTGETGRIYVYRRGELKNLGEALTGDE